MLDQLITALKALQAEIADGAMRQPGELTSAQYARYIGKFEGVGLALGVVEKALDKADKRDKEL